LLLARKDLRMDIARSCAIGFVFSSLLTIVPPETSGGEPSGAFTLRESARVGAATRVLVELKAEGLSLPASPPGLRGAQQPKPLAVRVETRFGFDERVLKVDDRGVPRRVARRVLEAAAAINGDVRPEATVLRPDVSLLLTEITEEGVVATSAGGPLTRAELELVEAAGDPLGMPALLPDRPVAVGDHWPIGALAARSLSGYDALASNGLEATLESLDENNAKIKLAGVVRGAALGGEGSITCAGSFSFDRRMARIDHLTLTRKESRKPGPVEAGLDIKSTITVDRRSIESPAELADGVLASLVEPSAPELKLLQFRSADGKYVLQHDRDWHIIADDERQAALKRLDHGEVVAQCNLAVGPNAGRGRHQNLEQFRSDIRRALGQRFEHIDSAGELDEPDDGVFRYRVAVKGHEGNVGVIWYYYLIANPDGEQLLATFTLGEAHAKQFDDQDLRIIGSLQWQKPGEGRSDAPEPD